MTEQLTITVNDQSSTAKWIRRLVGTVAVVVLHSLGVLMESAAMQWMGFFLTIIFGIGFIITEAKKINFKTYDEAIAHLQELKASAAAK